MKPIIALLLVCFFIGFVKTEGFLGISFKYLVVFSVIVYLAYIACYLYSNRGRFFRK